MQQLKCSKCGRSRNLCEYRKAMRTPPICAKCGQTNKRRNRYERNRRNNERRRSESQPATRSCVPRGERIITATEKAKLSRGSTPKATFEQIKQLRALGCDRPGMYEWTRTKAWKEIVKLEAIRRAEVSRLDRELSERLAS